MTPTNALRRHLAADSEQHGVSKPFSVPAGVGGSSIFAFPRRNLRGKSKTDGRAQKAVLRQPKGSGVSCPGFSAGGFFEKRTRVRFCVSVILVFSAATLMAAETVAEAQPTVTFDKALTSAFIALIAALTTWLGTRGHEERKAERKLKVEMERQPPLGEDVAKTYATKKELGNVETKLSGDIKDLRCQIDSNDKTLRTLIEANDLNAENRARGTHARIDTLGNALNKTNKALGVLIGMMCVVNKLNPKDIDQED